MGRDGRTGKRKTAGRDAAQSAGAGRVSGTDTRRGRAAVRGGPAPAAVRGEAAGGNADAEDGQAENAAAADPGGRTGPGGEAQLDAVTKAMRDFSLRG